MRRLIDILEDNLDNVAKKQNENTVDVAQIRANIQDEPSRTVVTKEIDGEPVETVITTKDPETDTTAKKVISADPSVPITNTITTKEVGDEVLTNYADDLTHMDESGICEDLNALDLQDLVKSTMFVDKHKSKLGEDKDVIVLAMEVKNNDAATDLMSFIERGYSDVIDADNISSEDINGDYVVFVEFERKDTFKNVLSEMLSGVERLTGIDDWSFKHYKSSKTLTMEELHERLPVTPEQYDSFLAKEKNIKDQLQQLKINARVPFK